MPDFARTPPLQCTVRWWGSLAYMRPALHLCWWAGGYYEGEYWALGRPGALGNSRRRRQHRVNIEAVQLVEGRADDGGLLYALADGKRHGVGKRVWVSGAR
jgi:hypothetical protein